MPELPDLVHIVKHLAPSIEGRRITAVKVTDPVLLRVLVPGTFEELLAGDRFVSLARHGPFLRFELERHDLVMHLMLTGCLRLAAATAKPLPYLGFSFSLDDGSMLSYGDEKSMGKIYLCPSGRYEALPGYLSQGIDVSGPDFTYETFSRLIYKKRNQARVFIMDHSLLSAIGNAYADEILFEARIHPKTPCNALTEADRRRLYGAIRKVLAWGIEEVEAAGRPLEDKVRGHMRVRNRAGRPCPVCGTTIRRAGVLGYDSFFCPNCQTNRTGKGLDWTLVPPQGEEGPGEILP